MNPSGGLPRRKTIIDDLRGAGAPLVLLDSGNALFKTPVEKGEAARAKAELILQTMGELGYAAMAVGPRDLSRGVEFLKTSAAKAKVPLLSANLVDGAGKRPFSASREVQLGERRIAVIGVSSVGPHPGAPGLKGEPPIAAAIAEAKRLRKTSVLVIVLAPIPYDDALALLQQSAGVVDFIVQSFEGRGATMAQREGKTFLFGPGERGRTVAKLTVALDASGDLVDRGDADRLAQRIQHLETNEKSLKTRIAATKDASAKQSLESLAENFREQRKALEAAGGKLPANARVFHLEHVNLGQNVASDPRLEQRIAPYANEAH